MRNFVAAALATSFLATSAFAATTAPLAPGKPAGVKQAQMTASTGMWLGLAVAIGGATAISMSGGSSSTLITTTSGTSP